MVSIQLGSPASGDMGGTVKPVVTVVLFPFNWDPQRVGTAKGSILEGRELPVSIQLGSPASGDSRWRVLKENTSMLVSIQLGSPASGDARVIAALACNCPFPFNWDPQRVGTEGAQWRGTGRVDEFPFNWDPQRVGTLEALPKCSAVMVFPFNWDPQRVGTRPLCLY